MWRRTNRIAIAAMLAACALALSAVGADAASDTFCVTAGPSGTPYPGCSGTTETSLSAAFTAADAAEPGTETLYLGPGTYTTSGANGFEDSSSNNPISIIGDGEGNTTLTTSTAGGWVLDLDDGTLTNDQQSSVSNLTVAMNDGGVGVFVPQHVTNVAITDSGSGVGPRCGRRTRPSAT